MHALVDAAVIDRKRVWQRGGDITRPAWSVERVLDGFKAVNDGRGHEAGGPLLVATVTEQAPGRAVTCPFLTVPGPEGVLKALSLLFSPADAVGCLRL
jgi:hypothetical protein